MEKHTDKSGDKNWADTCRWGDKTLTLTWYGYKGHVQYNDNHSVLRWDLNAVKCVGAGNPKAREQCSCKTQAPMLLRCEVGMVRRPTEDERREREGVYS